ncbi:MAG TPA: GDSL-type esterase/lipase family protein [Planctomycetota bacterium]|nr:GDSL-type esterase/lipase family protein [Planctomycetota bacterium]
MRFLRRASLAVGGLLLALLLAELLLRAAGVGRPAALSPFGTEGAAAGVVVEDPELVYRFKPGVTLLDTYRINTLGYRGPEVGPRRPGQLRLLAVGDSTTFGLGVAEPQRWSDVLGRLLAALLQDRREVEVCNAGVPSYTSQQNLVQLERDLSALQPDIVLLHVTGHNDSCATHGLSDAELLAWARSGAGFWSRLSLVQALGLARPPSPGPAQLRVSPAELESNLHAAAARVRAAGAKLVFVISGRSESAVRHAPMQGEVDAIIERVAAQEDVPVADARPGFTGLLPRNDFLDSIHPDPDGHRLIAWAVLAALLEPGGPLADAPCADFGRAWLAARERGLPEAGAALRAADAPPGFRVLRDALASPNVDAWLAAGDASLPSALREQDPLGGARRPARLESRLRLAHAGRLPAPDKPADLLALAQDCATFHRPRDPLVGLLGGPDALAQASADDLALARALWVFEAGLGALVLPRDHRLDDATSALGADDAEGAAKLAAAALQLDPDSAPALLLHGRAIERLGQRDEADADFARAAALDPDSSTGQYLLGRAAHRRGDAAEEEACLRRAIALDPLLDVARHDLGVLLLAAGRLDEAELHLRVAQALRGAGFPDLPALLAQVARLRTGN